MGYALVLTRAIDSALASISMSSSAVAIVASDAGRATMLQGMVHLVILAVYLFTTIVP